MTPNQKSLLRAQPVFNVQGWLRHIADLLEAGVIMMHHHQISMDKEDLAIAARFTITDKKHLEMMEMGDNMDAQLKAERESEALLKASRDRKAAEATKTTMQKDELTHVDS